MKDVFKTATLNINGIATRTSVEMLEDYIRRHELYLLFLQEFNLA